MLVELWNTCDVVIVALARRSGGKQGGGGGGWKRRKAELLPTASADSVLQWCRHHRVKPKVSRVSVGHVESSEVLGRGTKLSCNFKTSNRGKLQE